MKGKINDMKEIIMKIFDQNAIEALIIFGMITILRILETIPPILQEIQNFYIMKTIIKMLKTRRE